jgi:hypothetical protein
VLQENQRLLYFLLFIFLNFVVIKKLLLKIKYFANEFMKRCIIKGYKNTNIENLSEYDPEDRLLEEVYNEKIVKKFDF